MLFRRHHILLSALKAAAVYLVLGTLWITLSDHIVAGLATDREALVTLQTYKGWFYVFLTGAIAFALWYRFHKRLAASAEQIQEAETLKHITLQSIGDAVIATDASERITILNPEACRLTGWTEREAIGRPLSEVFRIIDGETRQPSPNPAEKVLRTGKVVGLANHTILLGKDGREFQIADSGAPIDDGHGGIRGVVLVFRDVTSAYALQSAVAESEERLRLALRAISEGVWEMDPASGEIRWSRLFYQILGVSESESSRGMELLRQGLDPGDRRRLEEELAHLREHPGEAIDLRLKLTTPAGTANWIRLRGSHLPNPSGNARIYGTLADVTTEQQTELQLRLSQFGIERASVAIFQLDEEGRIYYANRQACRSLGYTFEELTRLDVSAIDPDIDLDSWKAHRQSVLDAGGSRRIVTRHKRKDGSIFPVEVLVSYMEFEGRRISFSFVTDLSDQKRTEKDLLALNADLREARDRAEASNRAKNDFLAVMSHEMRTPLNPVIGFASLLREEVTDPQHHQYIENIISSSEKLLGLIEEILTYADLDRSSLEPAETPFSPLELCESILAGMRDDAPAVPLELKLAEDSDPPIDKNLLLAGDQSQLTRILKNLLLNSVQHTREGAIQLFLKAESETGDRPQCRLRFAITDSGCGIDSDRLPQLFAPFEQLDNSSTREHQGLGLGLAICQKLVHLLGGEIGAESTPGKGSRFWFQLSFRQLSLQDLEPDSPPTLSSAGTVPSLTGEPVILIVEDHPDNARIAETLLINAGARTEIAWNGQAAVDCCRRQRMDLILMDLSMPRMDGFETTRAIRSGSGPNRDTPIVALTAHNGETVFHKCREAGMAALITKPIRPGRFLDQLAPFL
jgi:PAS domain S-box-containing protein